MSAPKIPKKQSLSFLDVLKFAANYWFRQPKKWFFILFVLLIAAFFETYVTHLMSNTYDKENNAGLPVWLSGVILAVSLTFILWYFVIYPIRLHQKNKLVN